MFTILKEFAFEACHCLTGLRPDHPCMRPHGHSYRVRVELGAHSLNEHGFVQDYRELDDIKHFIDNVLDHRDLNVVPVSPVDNTPMFQPSTAENIAWVLYRRFSGTYPLLRSISVSETQKTWCKYEP